MYAREMQKLTTTTVNAINYSHRQYNHNGMPVYTQQTYCEQYTPNTPLVRRNVYDMLYSIDAITNVDMLQKSLPAIAHNVNELLSMYGNKSLHDTAYKLQVIASQLVLNMHNVDALQRAQNEVLEVERAYNRLNFIQRFLYRKQQVNRLKIATDEVNKQVYMVRQNNNDTLYLLQVISYNLRLFVQSITA
jgi:ribosomal protein L31E